MNKIISDDSPKRKKSATCTITPVYPSKLHQDTGNWLAITSIRKEKINS